MFPEEFVGEDCDVRRLHRTIDPAQYVEWASDRDLLVATTREFDLFGSSPTDDVPELFETPGDDCEGGPTAWYVVHDRDGHLAGVVGMTVQWQLKRADLGTKAPAEAWRTEVITDALRSLVGCAFEQLGLDVVITGHRSERSLVHDQLSSFVADCGGGRGGTFTNWIVVNGRPHDLVRYVIDEPTWVSTGRDSR